MPGPLIKGYKLNNLAITINQGMGRNLQLLDLIKISMIIRVEAIGKKSLYMPPTILSRWQAYAMHHQQVDFAPRRALIAIWRYYSLSTF